MLFDGPLITCDTILNMASWQFLQMHAIYIYIYYLESLSLYIFYIPESIFIQVLSLGPWSGNTAPQYSAMLRIHPEKVKSMDVRRPTDETDETLSVVGRCSKRTNKSKTTLNNYSWDFDAVVLLFRFCRAGDFLSDGDRLIVVPDGTDCLNSGSVQIPTL